MDGCVFSRLEIKTKNSFSSVHHSVRFGHTKEESWQSFRGLHTRTNFFLTWTTTTLSRPTTSRKFRFLFIFLFFFVFRFFLQFLLQSHTQSVSHSPGLPISPLRPHLSLSLFLSKWCAPLCNAQFTFYILRWRKAAPPPLFTHKEGAEVDRLSGKKKTSKGGFAMHRFLLMGHVITGGRDKKKWGVEKWATSLRTLFWG